MKKDDVFAVSLDQGAIIIDFNEFASKLTGYSLKEVIGKNWFEIFIKPSNMIEILDVFTGLLNGNNMYWEHTNEIICKDNRKITLKWTNKIVVDEKNKQKFIRSTGIVVS